MTGAALPKVHVTGAAGAGVSTLGSALAAALGVQHLETDLFYWAPTDPPFTRSRPVEERVRLMRTAMGQGGWVLAGSADPWGDAVTAEAGLIVFLTCPTPLRLARLKRRERALFGDRIGTGETWSAFTRISSGGRRGMTIRTLGSGRWRGIATGCVG